MKKLLGSALALALLASVGTANAELLKNFKFGGSVEVNAVSAKHVTNFIKSAAGNNGGGVAQDRVGTGQTRIMLNMDWDLLDDVHAKVTLSKSNRVYGNASERFNDGAANTGFLNNIYVQQGYFKIDKVFNHVDMTFGRQFFGEPGDLIAYYGPKYDQYGMGVTAIDGARFDWSGEKLYATVVAFQPDANTKTLAITDNKTAPIQQDVRGFIVGNKGHENIDAKVYVWNMMSHGNANATFQTGNDIKNSNLYVAGFKVKAKFGGAYGSAEFAQNLGEDRTTGGTPSNYVGRAFLVDGGMKADVEQIGMFNPWISFGLGTGRANQGYGKNEDFQAIATDYRPGAIYGRFDATQATGVNFFGANGAAGTGLQNRVILGFGVKATPSAINKLTVGGQFYDFRFHKIAHASANDTAAVSGNKHIGSEIDVTAEWKHSENVSLKATGGNFQPGGFIRNVINNGTAGSSLTQVQHVSSAWLGAFDVSVKF